MAEVTQWCVLLRHRAVVVEKHPGIAFGDVVRPANLEIQTRGLVSTYVCLVLVCAVLCGESVHVCICVVRDCMHGIVR